MLSAALSRIEWQMAMPNLISQKRQLFQLPRDKLIRNVFPTSYPGGYTKQTWKLRCGSMGLGKHSSHPYVIKLVLWLKPYYVTLNYEKVNFAFILYSITSLILIARDIK